MIAFPKKDTKNRDGRYQRYYDAFQGYLYNALRAVHCKLHVTRIPAVTLTKFVLGINNHRILFDCSDHVDILPNVSEYQSCFKYHYNAEKHDHLKNVHPFSPISFYDWKNYFLLKEEIIYAPVKDLVLNCQEPRAGAVARRRFVQGLLLNAFGDEVDLKWNYRQQDYWRMISKCLVHVFVPGARNNMLDRGHFQYLAFGCCTISPEITDWLPFNRKIEAGVHYVQCENDYSDLIEKIDWCKENREECLIIGQQAKELFEQTSTPGRLAAWIKEIVGTI